jgi:hypothetical protein
MSSVMSISTQNFAEGKLVFKSNEELEDTVLRILEMNSYENMSIESFDMEVFEEGETCPKGCTSEFDFVHLVMKVSLERSGGKPPVEFWIHRDLEFPFDR